MFKRMFTNVKSAVGDLLDEVNDESALETYTCFLTVADSSLGCFDTKQEITITFTDDTINFAIDSEGKYHITISDSSIQEVAFRTTTINGRSFKGSYLSFQYKDRQEYIYLNASSLEPHFFLECVQKVRTFAEMDYKRNARTTPPLTQVCACCGAVIEDANCPHCGMTNIMSQNTESKSKYVYEVLPRYKASLRIHNTSLTHIAEDDKVYYHIYEDCISLKIHGMGPNYIPVNLVILFENILDFSLKQYGSTSTKTGLYLTFKEHGDQFIQFQICTSDPKAPSVNLAQIKDSFNLYDIFDMPNNQHGNRKKRCEYCGLEITDPICPHCGGVNL